MYDNPYYWFIILYLL